MLVGRRVAVVTAHDAAYRTALDLHAAGAQIAAIVDVRAAAGGELPQSGAVPRDCRYTQA